MAKTSHSFGSQRVIELSDSQMVPGFFEGVLAEEALVQPITHSGCCSLREIEIRLLKSTSFSIGVNYFRLKRLGRHSFDFSDRSYGWRE